MPEAKPNDSAVKDENELRGINVLYQMACLDALIHGMPIPKYPTEEEKNA
ncbi:hypothetical protein UFOVP731_27 [uncultured Caudovirales phage]|uniref:Uncharacterized protein n=1 Tax=uncultured Caudovirales phage TaxID=2100421 RepID=A0A6J5NVA6_9CAUD|nr:hypothetical protein UFOVP731_27 [uncultured Caudovirales phage]